MSAQTFLDLTHWRKVLYAADLSPTAAKVGAYLSDRVHSAFGYAWPHIKTIAADTRLALATVKRALRELKRQGLILIESGQGWRSSRYWCQLPSGVSSDTAVVSAATPPMEKVNLGDYLSPSPQESAVEEDQDRPMRAPESGLAPQPQPITPPQPEIASESDTDPADEALAVIVALIAVSGAKYSTKPGSGPMKAAERALRVATVEELKAVVAWCAATWSNPKYLTPSAVLKPSKIEERVAAAKASAPAGTRAQAHKLFEREPAIEKAKPETVRGHIGALRAALSR